MAFQLTPWFRRRAGSSGGWRRPPRSSPSKPKLEALEDRNLLSLWSTVASMPTARGYLAAAKGPDGRIFAIGGEDNTRNFLNTVEAFNPLFNSWSTVASMPTGRDGLAAATGITGRIYAYGGYDGTSFLSTVEAYSPFSNTWSTVSPMTTPRSGLAGTSSFNGTIYAFGGYDGSNYLNTAEAYNVFTDTWSPIANMSIGRYGAAAATSLDGRIYVIGGLGVDPSSGLFSPVNTVEAYNPFSKSWSTVAPMSTAREFPAAVTSIAGRIFVFGGQDADGNILSTVEAYNVFTNTWSTVDPMPTARFGLAAAFGITGRLYAIGGFGLVDDGSGSLNLSALNTVESLPFFPGFGGAASGAKSPADVSGPTIPGTLSTTPLTVRSLPGVTDPWIVQGRGSSHTALQNQADIVFAAGINPWPNSLADTLSAGTLG